MASSKFVLVVTSPDDGNTVASMIGTGVGGNPNTVGAGAWDTVRAISDYLVALAQGSGVNIRYYDTAVSASTTGTFTGAATATETITINGVVFTARNSAPAANEFVVSSTVATGAANLAAAVNASTTAGIINVVGATSALGVVTFFSIVPGEGGKNIPITEALSNFTLAATTFSTGGTKAHNATISAGL